MNPKYLKTPLLLAVVGGALVGCAPVAPADIDANGNLAAITDGTRVRVFDYAAAVAAHNGGSTTTTVNPAGNSPRILRTHNLDSGFGSTIHEVRISPVNNGERALAIVHHWNNSARRYTNSFFWLGTNSDYRVRLDPRPFDGFSWGYRFSPNGTRLAFSRTFTENGANRFEVALFNAPRQNAGNNENVGAPVRYRLPEGASHLSWFDDRFLLLAQGRKIAVVDTTKSPAAHPKDNVRILHTVADDRGLEALGRNSSGIVFVLSRQEGPSNNRTVWYRGFALPFNGGEAGNPGAPTPLGNEITYWANAVPNPNDRGIGPALRLASDGGGFAMVGHRVGNRQMQRVIVNYRFSASGVRVFQEPVRSGGGSGMDIIVRPNSFLAGEAYQQFIFARTSN